MQTVQLEMQLKHDSMQITAEICHYIPNLYSACCMVMLHSMPAVSEMKSASEVNSISCLSQSNETHTGQYLFTTTIINTTTFLR